MFQHSLANLWVSYNTRPGSVYVIKKVSAFSGESLGELHWIGIQLMQPPPVSAFSGESLGELPTALQFQTWTGQPFQHSLANLWVSYLI